MARPKTKTATQSKNEYAKKAYDDFRLQGKKGSRELVKKYAIEKGYGGIQPYLKALVEKDSGIEL